MHEAAIRMRHPREICELLSRPNTGTAETGAQQGWWLVHGKVPGIKAVVVKRSVEEVIASTLRLDIPGIIFDERALRRNLAYGDRMLDKIALIGGVLSVNYSDLDREDACAAIFEHCLPYRFDRRWWNRIRGQNVQANVGETLTYYVRNKDAVDLFKKRCKVELRKMRKELPNLPIWETA